MGAVQVLLKRLKIITEWYPGKVTLEGEDPDEQIMNHLNSARIILLLVSPDFIFSEEHGNIEVERAMERHNQGVRPRVVCSDLEWDGGCFPR